MGGAFERAVFRGPNPELPLRAAHTALGARRGGHPHAADREAAAEITADHPYSRTQDAREGGRKPDPGVHGP